MCNTYNVLWIQKLAQMHIMYMYNADEHELFISPFVIQSVYMYMYSSLGSRPPPFRASFNYA